MRGVHEQRTYDNADRSVHVFFCTTDGGANEVAARKYVATLTKSIPNLLFLENTCMEHSHHLITMGSLQLVDSLLSSFAGRSWKYYSSLAIFTNVARSVSKQLYYAWCEQFDASSAAIYVKKMYPRCCSTRWGSIATTEGRMLDAGCQRLESALGLALAAKVIDKCKTEKAKPREQKLENDRSLNPDVLAVEAIKQYQIQMGKWRAHALKVLGDPLFETTIRVMQKTREPVMHLSHFLKISSFSAQKDRKGMHLGQLVCGKAPEIQESFNDILSH